ncbi:glycosyltransferase family 1 protein [Alloiococcus sp. CFN-8]|uniref:glycosyltransferase family 1 protein n=1 Tax=Alloiococcus sp. CFN-8 TaxID=3416081 RepID=UPI003CF39E3E
MIRVLHVVTYMGRGGLETMLMNYYRHIDRDKLQFDFLVHRDFEADYDEEIKKLGGRIYHLPKLNPFSTSYLHQLDSFFKEHKEYSIVHSHLDCMAGIPLKYAKKNGVPIRIAHAHSSSQTKDSKYCLKLLYKKNIPRYATDLFACSQSAGEWMFGNRRFTVMNNAIDSERYSYNKKTSFEMRRYFDIPQDSLVVGHVGRFAPPKNHSFIIKVFSDISKQKPNARLLLVGEGELKNEIIEMVTDLGIQNKVIFTGVRSDIPELMQAMDVFLFPSNYEGLPVAIIEAQASGLPCIISDKVPIECKKTELVRQVSLSEDISKWAEEVIDSSRCPRYDTSEFIRESGFDICESSKVMEQFYLQAYLKAAERGVQYGSINSIHANI